MSAIVMTPSQIKAEKENIDEILRNAVNAAYRRAGFRAATHSHRWTWARSASPRAESESGSERPSKLGLSRAYQRRAFWCATSAHRLYVANDWLESVYERGLETVDGMLTLACATEPDLTARADGRAYAATWVRQGKGTSLVTERGWLVQRENGTWTHAYTHIGARKVGGSVAQVELFTGPWEEALERNPLVTVRDARAAGLCAPGINDWLERHNDGSRKAIRAQALWRIATASGDRMALVELAIRQAVGREASKQASKRQASKRQASKQQASKQQASKAA